MKVKTSELTNAALDWAIGTADGGLYQPRSARDSFWIWPGEPVKYSEAAPAYSTDWAQGGPIIERERISIRQWTNVPLVHAYMPQDNAPWLSDGTSPLIAGMRCYCSFKLGDEVDVPEELM